MRRSLFVRSGIALLMAASLAGACSGDKAPRRGQIMVALQTDMSIPKDVSRIYLRVTVDGEVKHANTYAVAPNGDTDLPATLAIVAGEQEAPSVQVLVVGLKVDEARTLSKVVTTVPRDRIATLHVPIQWLCDGTARPIPGTDDFDTTCQGETACVAGSCQDINIPEPMLPTYSPPDVFGGGQGPDDPFARCFEVTSCFAGSMDVVPDSSCQVTVSVPPGAELNFAARTEPVVGDGVCDEEDPEAPCFVVLDKSEKYGWYELTAGSTDGRGGSSSTGGPAPGLDAGGEDPAPDDGDLPPDQRSSAPRYRTQAEPPVGSTKTIQLPPVLCDKLNMGRAQGISVSTSCPSKTDRFVTCGPWTTLQPVEELPVIDGGFNDACPGFPASADSLSTDPLQNRFLTASADFLAQTDQAKTMAFQSCANIVGLLGGSTPTAPMPPSDADVTAACESARSLLAADAEAQGSVLVTPGFCTAPTDEQQNCEGQCAPIAACDPLPFETRCYDGGGDLVGSCDSTCTGDCLGTRGAPASCDGYCDGVCIGTCSFECTNPDGSQTLEGPCSGWCDSICGGSCEGTCYASSAQCDQGCSGAGSETGCLGTLTDPTCSLALAEDTCVNLACASTCAAEASLGETCEVTYAAYYGQGPSEYRQAIDQNFGPLLDAIVKYEHLAYGIGKLSAAASEIAASADPTSLGCVSVATQSISLAVSSLVTMLTSVEAVLTSVEGGGGTTVPDGGLPPASCDPGDDTPCFECAKTYCCSEYQACSTSEFCMTEIGCVSSCISGGTDPVQCESTCSLRGTGSIEPVTADLLACINTPECGSTCGFCSGSAGGDAETCDLTSNCLGIDYALNCNGVSCICTQGGVQAGGFDQIPAFCTAQDALFTAWTDQCFFPALQNAPTP